MALANDQAYFVEDRSKLVKRQNRSYCMSDTLKSLFPIITMVSVITVIVHISLCIIYRFPLSEAQTEIEMVPKSKDFGAVISILSISTCAGFYS